MKRLCMILLLAGCGASARTHVERAVEAHGGLDALRAVRNLHVATEGNVMGMPYTTTVHWRRPYDWRYDMEAAWGNMSMWALGAEGAAYASMRGKATKQVGEQRRGILAHARGATAAMLPDRLLDENVQLELAEPIEIGGRTYEGVEAYFGDKIRPMAYYFDPDTKRIHRLRFTFFESESLTWLTSTLDLSDYRQVDGIWIAHKSAMDWAGAAIAEQVTEVRLNRTPDATVFATPETVPPPTVRIRHEAATQVAVHRFVGPPDQIGGAIARVMAWISSLGGQPAGPTTTVYRKPTNYADINSNEVVIQVPVQLEKAPPDGDIRLGKLGAFDFAYLTFTGNPMEATHHFGTVYEWCQNNGYRRSGPRRMRTLKLDPETGLLTAEIGFPVKRAPTATGRYYPGG